MSLADEHCVVPLPKASGMLDKLAIATLLAELPEWKIDGGALCRTFVFATFPEAIAFVQRVAVLAEAENHHPDLDIRYTRVTLALVTHDVGGISRNDFVLAARAQDLA